jgi:uncharacterized protein YndB with AHSA1/START domain
MTETRLEGNSVTLTHHAEAAIERVFRAFADAGELKCWFGPEGMGIKSAQMDARVGGAYRVEMQSPDGDIYTVKGTIQELSQPDTIAYTWTWEEDEEADEHESLVTIRLTSTGESTDIELIHTRLASDESAQRHREGWTSTFSDLERYLQVD